ncbi:fibronectin type III domain-containing protein 7-like [Acanthochromis polyacanthus]|uniref:fibronectin type III domain-containing protein 7-like n=1 Tax=Acanthochromis polyacanthus TaxID=80966 RepID=UPI002233E84E|nr:fibronectin type III domain-containing protein 7-like [Acanthochromis polyacanthus]
MMCSSDTGMVWWEEGESVSSYKVRAFGPDGHKIECHSTEGSCELPNMHCGQLYNLTVTAQDGRCDNSHTDLTLQSVPCKPTSVKAALRCHSNSVAVTWEQGSGGRSYVAVAVAADGSHQTECNNTMTYCDLTSLQCGQTYNISVFSQDESCSSIVSDEAYVRTAPCTPQNVTVDAQCDEDAMVVSWSPNPDARYFHVAAVSNTMARLYCNSSGTMCTLNNLPCGQSYNVTVLSVRDDCESKPSRVVETSSVPCVPMNAKGDLDCVSNSAWVSWDDSKGATSYFVLAQSAGGHSSNCTASSSHCNVPDLKCGTLYTFHVTAMNKHCSSNHSATFEIETGPCALTSVNATTECHNDTILVEWEDTVDMPLYLVTAEADDQTTISCKSTSNKCLLENVVCGTHYSIIVSASSDKCSTLRSPPRKIKTVPCAPENVTAVPSCEENGATVTWAKSPVARSYHLTATGEDGHVVNCSSSVNNCSLADLHCGQMYNFSITARGDDCTSYPSISSFRTVPCAPSGLAVDLDCRTNSAMLSWTASEGAMEYFSCAQPMDGDALYCGSNITSCTFKGLECGDIYNFSVQASNGICNSSFSPPLQMGAAPCPPTYLDVHMQRIDEMFWAMISWDRVNCSDVKYLAEIIGRINNNPQTLMNISSYWLPLPYFEFPMPCSTAYNVTVRSKNSAGVSEPSRMFSGVTVPCPPQNLRYTGDRQSAVLSWDASVFATWYTVTSVVDGVRVTLCNTTEISCVVSNFNPNTTEVTASNDVGESNPNGNITGPMSARRRRDLRTTQVVAHLEENLEMPEELTVTAKGVSLYVKWKAVKGATEYTVIINEKPREELSSPTPVVRSVEGTSHRETGLKPWTRYCVKVAAKNVINQSNYSDKCTNTTAS